VARGTKTVNARVRGVDPAFGEMRNIIPAAGGRFLNEMDSALKRRSVVLGDELATDLFGKEEPVGKTVVINQSTFLVVGVMQPKVMMGMYSGPDKNQASIPAPTFKAMFTDAKIGNMVYKPANAQVADQAKAQIYRVLARKYRFDPDDTRALGVWDTRENQRITGNIALGIQMFLGIIGGLTLFVGGMGVANIMYAVVKERTREIGVKMALGAKVRPDHVALRARGSHHDHPGWHPRHRGRRSPSCRSSPPCPSRTRPSSSWAGRRSRPPSPPPPP
jgi:putative ABC transport system permease protein